MISWIAVQHNHPTARLIKIMKQGQAPAIVIDYKPPSQGRERERKSPTHLPQWGAPGETKVDIIQPPLWSAIKQRDENLLTGQVAVIIMQRLSAAMRLDARSNMHHPRRVMTHRGRGWDGAPICGKFIAA